MIICMYELKLMNWPIFWMKWHCQVHTWFLFGICLPVSCFWRLRKTSDKIARYYSSMISRWKSNLHPHQSQFTLPTLLWDTLYVARCCISYAYACRLYSSFIGWIIFPGFAFCFISYVRLYHKRLEIIIIKCWRRRMIGILMCPQCGWICIANLEGGAQCRNLKGYSAASI